MQEDKPYSEEAIGAETGNKKKKKRKVKSREENGRKG